LPPYAHAGTLRVGPERNYKSIRAAAHAAGDGDVILIDAGVYPADITVWDRDNLVIWAPEGRAHVRADGANEDGKDLWVVVGRNFTAENIEFSGARVRDRNGAGVRIDAKGTVTLRNCYFHDNDNGVLGDADEIVIDGCVFDRNGAGDGQSHNLYVWGPSVTIRNSFIHRAVLGHNIKTRGETNHILYPRGAQPTTPHGGSAGHRSIRIRGCRIDGAQEEREDLSGRLEQDEEALAADSVAQEPRPGRSSSHALTGSK
jgi:hypothetical protein